MSTGMCNGDVSFYMIPTNVDAVIQSVKISHGMGVYAGHRYSLCYSNKYPNTQFFPIIHIRFNVKCNTCIHILHPFILMCGMVDSVWRYII